MAKKNNDEQPKDGKPSPESQEDALSKLTVPQRRSRFALGTKLRNYFLTGLIIVGPLCITLYVVWWFINFVDAWVKPLVPSIYNPDNYLPFSVPGIGLIFAIFGLMFIGALTANLFGRTLVSYGEMMLGRMPIVRNIYKALKQIFETILSQSGGSFKEAGLIEYPRRGLYAVVFISKDTRGEIQDRTPDEDDLISVFLPTTPNPTSGFLLFVPRREIQILDMSVEDAAKMVISAGLVEPPKANEAIEHAHPPAAASKTEPSTEPSTKNAS